MSESREPTPIPTTKNSFEGKAKDRTKIKPAPLFQVKEKLQRDRIVGSEQPSVIERQISPYEKAYTIGDYSYIVWTEGPKSGEVYRVVSSPTPEQLKNLPTFQEIQADTLRRLEEAAALNMERAGLNQSEKEKKASLDETMRIKLADLYVHLHKIYQGDKGTVGLEQAQLFDLDGEGQKYYELVQRLSDLRKGGFKGYLNELIDAHNISLKDTDLYRNPLMLDYYEQEAFHQYYYGKSLKEENRYYFPDDPVVLTHHTYGNALPMIIHMEGLAASDYLEEHGVKKHFGGEMGGEGSWPPNKVFFNSYPDGNSNILVSWGTKIGLEYPMIFGIDRTHAQGLNVRRGIYQNEVSTPDYVSIGNISHVFVPRFKVSEVSGILNEQGFSHVFVLPLGR